MPNYSLLRFNRIEVIFGYASTDAAIRRRVYIHFPLSLMATRYFRDVNSLTSNGLGGHSCNVLYRQQPQYQNDLKRSQLLPHVGHENGITGSGFRDLVWRDLPVLGVQDPAHLLAGQGGRLNCPAKVADGAPLVVDFDLGIKIGSLVREDFNRDCKHLGGGFVSQQVDIEGSKYY